jgi:serine/threonine protein kinase
MLLEKQLERAGKSIKERKKEDEEISKQREIFGKVRNSPWARGKKLGRGAFADVYEATSTLTGGKMAVKMIRLVGGFKERVKDLMNEIEILCSLAHPNIVHYFYCERAETTINLFMELADEGSLADMLAAQGNRLTEDQLATVTKQLLLAVNYLHDQGIIHRDIKPGNMLISKGKVKLSDFGTATSSVMGEGTQGTIFYMAPEVVDGHQYGKECDIWSIGCVMCECLGIKRPSRLNGLLGYGIPAAAAFPSDISPTVQDFILLCLQEEASERPTAGSLLLHDYVVGARQEMSQLRKPERGAQIQTWDNAAAESERDLSVSSGSSTPSW